MDEMFFGEILPSKSKTNFGAFTTFFMLLLQIKNKTIKLIIKLTAWELFLGLHLNKIKTKEDACIVAESQRD